MRKLRALGAARAFLFDLGWREVMTMIAAGALIGLGFGWVGAQAISRIVGGRTGLAVAATIARPELVIVLSLMLVGALLAMCPRGLELSAAGRRGPARSWQTNGLFGSKRRCYGASGDENVL
jgi:hypothetical protein